MSIETIETIFLILRAFFLYDSVIGLLGIFWSINFANKYLKTMLLDGDINYFLSIEKHFFLDNPAILAFDS